MMKIAGSGSIRFRCMDPRIRIRTKMTWILNTALNYSRLQKEKQKYNKEQPTYLISFLVEESQGGEVDEEPVGRVSDPDPYPDPH